MKAKQSIKGKENLQAHNIDESEQGIGNVTDSHVVGANINGSNISINELPSEIIIMLLRIIISLLPDDKKDYK